MLRTRRSVRSKSGIKVPDYRVVKPEAFYGIAPPMRAVNWDALEFVVRTTEGSALQKKHFRRKFFKAIREHGLVAMTPWFRYHYVSARLALGDFSDYWGWEFRGLTPEGSADECDDWAATVFYERTWMDKWNGQPAETVLVIAEQGIGDQVFFASILPEVLCRANRVIFECDDRLHGLLERSFPRLECRPETTFEDRRERYGEVTAFIPAADLMRMFRRDVRHFPGKAYLKPDPKLVEKFERYRGRTGIAWYGRQGKLNPKDLEIDAPLSLQYKFSEAGIEEPVGIDLFSDIDELVALCSVLGRVVTVPQSVHHFAGAVGTKVEIVLPPDGSGEVKGQVMWDRSPFIQNGKLPWYRDCRVFHGVENWRKNHAPYEKRVEEGRVGEHPAGNEVRQAAEAGDCHCA